MKMNYSIDNFNNDITPENSHTHIIFTIFQFYRHEVKAVHCSLLMFMMIFD